MQKFLQIFRNHIILIKYSWQPSQKMDPKILPQFHRPSSYSSSNSRFRLLTWFGPKADSNIRLADFEISPRQSALRARHKSPDFPRNRTYWTGDNKIQRLLWSSSFFPAFSSLILLSKLRCLYI